MFFFGGGNQPLVTVGVRFMLKHLDVELTALLHNTVPPCDLDAVSAFRLCMQTHAKEVSKGSGVTQVQCCVFLCARFTDI